MEAEAKGTKEIVELMECLALLAKSCVAVAKDGKVDLADLKVAFELIQKSSVIMSAIDGITEVPAEIKDLSLEECQALLMKLVAYIADIKAA